MALRDEGFRQVQSESRLAGRTYLRDQQCYDMLLFAHDQREFLETNHLVEEGHLVIQVGITSQQTRNVDPMPIYYWPVV